MWNRKQNRNIRFLVGFAVQNNMRKLWHGGFVIDHNNAGQKTRNGKQGRKMKMELKQTNKKNQRPEKSVETVLLDKKKIKIALLQSDKTIAEMLLHLGIHYQTWAHRNSENTWPIPRALEMARFLGVPVSMLQSDLSLVKVFDDQIKIQ